MAPRRTSQKFGLGRRWALEMETTQGTAICGIGVIVLNEVRNDADFSESLVVIALGEITTLITEASRSRQDDVWYPGPC